jgi:DNA gyrase subunit A
MLDQGVPKTLGLKDIIAKYIDYQKEVIIRRTRFDLDVAEKRVHILEGLTIALDNIDEVIKLIRASKTDEEAKTGLMNNFKLTEIQANAILEMRLRRLTGLEREKIENELNDLLKLIEELKSILASEEKILGVIKEELLEIKQKYADERRTNIDMTAIEYIEDESLIPEEDIIVTLTNNGYIKRLRTDTYRTQNRGGVGVKGMTTNEEDFVSHLIATKTHNYILFFSNLGRVYRIKGYEIPEFSRQSKGLPIINLLQLEKEEYIRSIVEIDPNDDQLKYLMFATKNGIVKRTAIEEFDSIRKSGKIAIVLKENDELISVRKTNGTSEIVLGASNGRMVRFVEDEVRSMGRSSSGVKGMELDGAHIVGAEMIHSGEQILIVTEKGYGKKTNVEEYRLTHRGSKGVKTLNVTEKNGNLVSIRAVCGDEDVLLITDTGIIIRISLEQISPLKRATQGVRLINLKDNCTLATVATVAKDDEVEELTEEES